MNRIELSREEQIALLKTRFAGCDDGFIDNLTDEQNDEMIEKVRCSCYENRNLKVQVTEIPWECDGIETDGMPSEIYEIPPGSDIDIYQMHIEIDDKKAGLHTSAYGFSFRAVDFFFNPAYFLQTLDGEGAEEVEAGVIMLENMFPGIIQGKQPIDENEGKFASDLNVSSPSMVWPEIMGSPYAEWRFETYGPKLINRIINHKVVLLTYIDHDEKCPKRSVDNLLRFLKENIFENYYVCCTVYEKSGYDDETELYMVEKADKMDLDIGGDLTNGHYAYRIHSILKRYQRSLCTIRKIGWENLN